MVGRTFAQAALLFILSIQLIHISKGGTQDVENQELKITFKGNQASAIEKPEGRIIRESGRKLQKQKNINGHQLKKTRRKQRKQQKQWKYKKNLKQNKNKSQTKRKNLGKNKTIKKRFKTKGKRFKKLRYYKNISRMKVIQISCQDIKQCTRDSIKVSNQLRQVKRIKRACDLMNNKATKSKDAFNVTLSSLDSALASRVQSNGGLITIRDELKTCSTSAAAKCQSSTVVACQNRTLLDTCKTTLQGWINLFGQSKGCLQNSEEDFTSCVTSLPSPIQSFPGCLIFDNLSKEAIKSKKQCTNSSETGSFGYCKKLQDQVAESAGALAAGCSSTATTMAESGTSSECPEGWKIFGSKCYHLLPQRIVTYNSAAEKCKEYGAELVSLETKNENEFVENMLNEARDNGILSVGTSPKESTDIWLSARRPNTGSPFTWTTGSSLVYSDWHSGQPSANSDGIALCMQTVRNDGNFWAWWVTNCDGGDIDNAVVCEKNRGECDNVEEVTIAISRGIFTYRSYFNHYKTINRTKGWIDKIENKAEFSQLIKYDEAAANLKSVTKDGTACPGNRSLAENVTELVAHLTQCGNATSSKIVRECNPNNIPDYAESWPAQKECAIQYDLWNNAFTICFGHGGYQPTYQPPRTCSCFADLKENPAVSNSMPQSCAFPNYDHSFNHVNDWIDVFNRDTKAVFDKCQREETTCKDFISEAFTLATTCCLKSSSSSGTSRISKRRIIFGNQMQNKLYMN